MPASFRDADGEGGAAEGAGVRKGMLKTDPQLSICGIPVLYRTLSKGAVKFKESDVLWPIKDRERELGKQDRQAMAHSASSSRCARAMFRIAGVCSGSYHIAVPVFVDNGIGSRVRQNKLNVPPL